MGAEQSMVAIEANILGVFFFFWYICISWLLSKKKCISWLGLGFEWPIYICTAESSLRRNDGSMNEWSFQAIKQNGGVPILIEASPTIILDLFMIKWKKETNWKRLMWSNFHIHCATMDDAPIKNTTRVKTNWCMLHVILSKIDQRSIKSRNVLCAL